jgi:putative ABC transport system permease protein
MIRSYFIIMLRSMLNQKFYSAINILCLTVGISFAMLIGVFIAEEMKVNQSLKDVDQLYLVQNKVRGNVSSIEWFTPGPLTKQAVESQPGSFESFYRFWDRNITVSKDDMHFRIQGMIGDSSFLQIFGFPILHGVAETALKEPNSIVITQGVANRFFNRTDVVNETLSVSTEQNGIKEYKITAVIAEPDDKNTVSDLMNMNAQIFISLENRSDFFTLVDLNDWKNEMIAYVKLTANTTHEKAEGELNKMLQTNAPKEISENRTMALSPLKDYYLITNHGAVQKLITSLIVIVIFILILAISNFINISIASSFSRLKEVGIRKVIGGYRRQVLSQFLLESFVMALIAGVLSLGIYQILTPVFQEVLNARFPSIFEFTGPYWLTILALILGIGLLAGAYPAIFQAATRPIDSLKGRALLTHGTISVSRWLIVLQFVITIFIFSASTILARQVSYFLEKDLGYTHSHILIVYSVPRIWNDEGFSKMDAAKKEFQKSAKVKSASLSWGAPGWLFNPAEVKISKPGESLDDANKIYITGADEQLASVYDLKLKEGNFLSRELADSSARDLVINEAAQQALGVALGDKLVIDGFADVEFTVSGIVEDFNYESLHEAVKPVVIMSNRDFAAFRFFSFRLEPGNLSESVAEVERLWKKVFPNDPFDFAFADDRLKALYATELQLRKASTLATVLMSIIVLTGILGLVSLNISKRIKEIGIRKVLGAKVTDILGLMSKEYARLVLLATAMAIPLSWYFGYRWLQNFVYHIELEWWMLIMPGMLLLIFTVAVVSSQSFKSAAANPVDSIKCE